MKLIINYYTDTIFVETKEHIVDKQIYDLMQFEKHFEQNGVTDLIDFNQSLEMCITNTKLIENYIIPAVNCRTATIITNKQKEHPTTNNNLKVPVVTSSNNIEELNQIINEFKVIEQKVKPKDKYILVKIIYMDKNYFYSFNTYSDEYIRIYKSYFIDLHNKMIKEEYYELNEILKAHMEFTWKSYEITPSSNLIIYNELNRGDNQVIYHNYFKSQYVFKLPLERQLDFREMIKCYLPKYVYEKYVIYWLYDWSDRFYTHFPKCILHIQKDASENRYLLPFFTSWLSFLIIEIGLEIKYQGTLDTHHKILYLFLDLLKHENSKTITQIFAIVSEKIDYYCEQRSISNSLILINPEWIKYTRC